MSSAVPIRVLEAEAFERPVPFRFAFRFGVAKVEAASQAFLRVRIADATGREAWGWAAEMLMPKWFDKSPDLTPAANVEQLRTSLRLAMDAIGAAGEGTAFGLHAAIEADHHAACAKAGLNGLIASFGLALVDRAVIDALGRLEGVSAERLVATNRLGITGATARDLADFPFADFLAGLRVPQSIHVRHTVGLGDALDNADLNGNRLNDGLPETLQEVIAAYGHSYFKLKVSGDIDADIARLKRIAAIVERLQPDYRATLDGNEQFENEAHVVAFLDALEAAPELASLREKLIFLEQPIARARALSAPVENIARRVPLEIDESDADIDAFLRARDLGYRGISSKSCKGFYRAILNRARIARWNAEARDALYFMSAEDLTTQSGIAVQQDLVLSGLIGARHVERNGHHFVDGMANASESEQSAFLAAHGDLYETRLGRTRLKIENGNVALKSVRAAPGLGSSVSPEFDAMAPLQPGGDT
ncbi:enolase C-terminal domain-like protein [Pelagibacterium xiamenense]|uniref:enolase C-terminal domain-like protein n=1 Tax=Pelagibacterium xiamenense TaxID=2901140 RepID=UPI001E44C353|nr:mandelate racemase [Pelagibacterium xiamenense]